MDKIERTQENPNYDLARCARVKQLIATVKDDIEHWSDDHERMRRNRKFARGLQWQGSTRKDLGDPNRSYVANITLRHLKQRTASTYARNPKWTWRKSKRMYHKLWDGTAKMLQDATKALMAPTPGPNAAAQQLIAQAVLTEAAEFAKQSQELDRFGETVAVLFDYFMREQIPPTKTMMKRLVLQQGTTGFGVAKMGFQRLPPEPANPDQASRLNDARSQLEAINRISQDLQEGEVLPEAAEVDQLKTLIKELETSGKMLLRAGLVMSYPDPLNIIPSKKMVFFPNFFGCPHVTELFHLTNDEIKEIYGKDLKGNYQRYQSTDPTNKSGNRQFYKKDDTGDCARVMEIWHKPDGMVYTVVDGYDDYLRMEPPRPWTERFWPWFTFAPLATDDPDNPMPPSEVELIDTQQMEINRTGEALRDHRYAARPGHVTAGVMDEQDATRLVSRAAHDVLPLRGLPVDGDVKRFLQPFPTAPIDPALYDTGPAYMDILRATGSQQANYGPTAGATATEASIASASREVTDESAIDELDDFLSDLARTGGQILLQEMTEAEVIEIVGPGAVWQVMDRDAVAKEIYLEVEAGSSGRKNQGAEMQALSQVGPLMMQTPGYSAEWFARHLLNILDPRIQPEDALEYGALSITAQNGIAQANANASPTAPPGTGEAAPPEAQGPEGSANAPTTQAGGAPGPQEPRHNEAPPTVM